MAKSILDAIEERLKYEKLEPEEKINYIKSLYNLKHGNGKRKKNKRKKKGMKK